MEPCYKVLPLNYNPQQKEFLIDGIKFSSKLDSGNLFSVDKLDKTTFNLYISPDCYGKEDSYPYRTWFYFAVSNKNDNLKNKEITFNICNMSNQTKMFRDGYKIVYRILKDNMNENLEKVEREYIYGEESYWKRLKKDKKQLRISFSYTFNDSNCILFSFCYPWSYTKNQKFLEYLNKNYEDNSTNLKKLFYYHSEILIYSKEKRALNLITISSYDGITYSREKKLKGMFPEINKDRPFIFVKNKPIIFISARVHPGETPSSFILNGVLKFLTSCDPRAELLLKNFVFKIIPMINVDGVSRGFYRHDTNALNMNRHYTNPSITTQPEIYAVRNLFLHYSNEFSVRFYLDLHGHVSTKGLFLFGNSLDFLPQVENSLLTELFSINSEYFALDHCVFNEKSMKSKEKGDKFSKEGSGRVYFHKCTNIIHSYTIEASCFTGLKRNTVTPLVRNTTQDPDIKLLPSHTLNKAFEFYEDKKEYNDCEDSQNNILFYTPFSYEKMGIAILISILDYEGKNPFTKICNTNYKNLKSIRSAVAMKLVKEDDKYKGNLYFQSIAKDIDNFKKFIPLTSIASQENKNLRFFRKNASIAFKNNIIITSNLKESKRNKSSTNSLNLKKEERGTINYLTENIKNYEKKDYNEKKSIKSKLPENKVVKDTIENYITNTTISLTKFDYGELMKEIKIKRNNIPKSGLITYKKNYQSFKESEMRYILFPDINKNKKDKKVGNFG